MHYTNTGAIVSKCGQFRYRLWRRWKDGSRVAVFIMLNPSTADGEKDDATIRKCVGFADRMGCNGIEIINLFAYRATKPSDRKAAGYLVGPDNYSHIRAVLNTYSDNVICAWGANARCPAGAAQVSSVMQMLSDGFFACYALKKSPDGTPHHPLMLPYSSELVTVYEPLC